MAEENGARPCDSDWYNIPDIVVDNVSRVCKVAAGLEVRCSALERQVQKLGQENQKLQKQLRQLQQKQGDHGVTARTPEALGAEDVEAVKQRVQQELSPEYFQPLIQQQLDVVNARLQSDFIRVYEVVNGKASHEAVQKYVRQHVGDLKAVLLQFKLKLQHALAAKADISSVNEALVGKVDGGKLADVLERFAARDDVERLGRRGDEAAAQLAAAGRRLEALDERVATLQRGHMVSGAAGQGLLKRLEELNAKIVANAAQISQIEAVSQQAHRLATSLSSKHADETGMLMEPVFSSLRQHQHQIALLQHTVERCVELCLKRAGGRIYEAQCARIERELRAANLHSSAPPNTD